MATFSSVIAAIVIFASTDVDDLLVLIAFYSDPKISRVHIVIGQVFGIIFLVGVSLAGALVALALSASYVGLLGFIPLALGTRKLVELCWGAKEAESPSSSRSGDIFSVMAVTIANGGDNIGVYVPLFATQTPWAMGVTIAVFIAMAFVWCSAARALVAHRTFRGPVERYGRASLPFVLIFLGARILYSSGAVPLILGTM